ncbi:PLP-dependent cysteine synthase family protein [Haliangium sp.]|uniref:PLP-dependent cysteine synthase family protein n=1 Tax=Haliangium sp. TaxID=2663208 RepID=UPI003D1516C3
MATPPTPLIELARLAPCLYTKVEYQHPSGSMKHRSIPRFLRALLERGELRPRQTVAIHSAGAAAVTTAWAGAQLGLPVVAVLPPFATDTTVAALRWLGASCHRVPPARGKALMQDLGATPDVYVLAQAREPELIDHYRAVAAEVLEQLGDVAAITVGIGTGLSITGIAREVKDRGVATLVYGTEPAESAVASGQPWAPHRIPGLAPPIPQDLLEIDLLAGIEPVPSDEAWECAQRVARGEGLLVGPSAGATIAAALRLRARGLAGPIVAVCACSMSEYLDMLPAEASQPPPAGAPGAR